jgi:hypothetical protein
VAAWVLAERGPDLGRPVVDRIVSSRHRNMKEQRGAKAGALRVLFAFDPRRTAILLLGGDRFRPPPSPPYLLGPVHRAAR